jgi:hypothetical protein
MNSISSAAIAPSPFSNQDFFLTGGNVAVSVTEVLTKSGWQLINPSFPVTVYAHCMVLLNLTAAMVIGGIQNGVASAQTFIISNNNRVSFLTKYS